MIRIATRSSYEIDNDLINVYFEKTDNVAVNCDGYSLEIPCLLFVFVYDQVLAVVIVFTTTVYDQL